MSEGKKGVIPYTPPTLCERQFYQKPSEGLEIDASLGHNIDLSSSPSSPAEPSFEDFLKTMDDFELFGAPDTLKREATLRTAVDLGQIARMIAAQSGGTSGPLLNDGYTNIFPVIGKNGELFVVHVCLGLSGKTLSTLRPTWRIFCASPSSDGFTKGHLRVFHNKFAKIPKRSWISWVKNKLLS